MDGKINAEKINITSITPETLELISPMLCKMEDRDQTLDMKAFFEAADELYASLPPPDKIRFLDLDKNKKKVDGGDCSF